ncbi:LAMI_0G06546g1_1 [Lachancea mirantina]|uniref:LAMI_0G06546g1_1 n=1 Tax=Lachancea mirantina TaxID=1230905 RepID=A0A1G4K9E8_9SACH|nr:LAMI_0G06546g1_1 [Lachancea mirantina]
MKDSKPLPTPPDPNDANKSLERSPQRASTDGNEEEFEFFHEFTREKVKDLIHNITLEIKARGRDIEYLLLPFRPQQSNEKLLKFLNQIFPLGNGTAIPAEKQKRLIQRTEPWTLYQALKYIWCRLPSEEVIGWNAFDTFSALENENGYPPRAFLDFMPKCLSSPEHASIVYDFFDLIVAIASNSKNNKMSARKISKMFAIWGFGRKVAGSGYYGFDHQSEPSKISNSFRDGLDQWIPASDAMFHLLLAFIRSFVPDDLETADIPLTLKNVLFNNEYPPKGSTAYSSDTILTVPIVSLMTHEFSRKPWQLIERCNELLDFTNYDAFEAREDYALLKSLFKKNRNIEVISHKMSQESKRLMKEMSTKHSTFQAGWAKRRCVKSMSEKRTSFVEVKRVEIDDYFIWAWLSTLSYEQTSEKRKTFGRSLILEFEFDGFKKWVILEECDLILNAQKCKKMDDLKFVEESKTSYDVETHSQEVSRDVASNFQSRPYVSQSGPEVKHEAPAGYHTVINPQHFNKEKTKPNVNLQIIEQKFSKWNPLHSRKKNGNRSSSGSTSQSSKGSKDTTDSSKTDETRTKNTSEKQATKKNSSRILSQYSILNPDNFKLPPVESEEFTISLPQLSPVKSYSSESGPNDYPQRAEKRSSDTIEDINRMVNELAQEASNKEKELPIPPVNEAEEDESETFESLTMFDKYKQRPDFDEAPGNLNESAASSVVQPLKLSNNGTTESVRTTSPLPSPAPTTGMALYPYSSSHSHENREPLSAAESTNRPAPRVEHSQQSVAPMTAEAEHRPTGNHQQTAAPVTLNEQKYRRDHPQLVQNTRIDGRAQLGWNAGNGNATKQDIHSQAVEVPRVYTAPQVMPPRARFEARNVVHSPPQTSQFSRGMEENPPQSMQVESHREAAMGQVPHDRNSAQGSAFKHPPNLAYAQSGSPASSRQPQFAARPQFYNSTTLTPPGASQFLANPSGPLANGPPNAYANPNGLSSPPTNQLSYSPILTESHAPHQNLTPPGFVSPSYRQPIHGNYPAPPPPHGHFTSPAAPQHGHFASPAAPNNGFVSPEIHSPHNGRETNYQHIAKPYQTPSTAFYSAPNPPVGSKLHGGNFTKNQERKRLHNNIRNGNFGI